MTFETPAAYQLLEARATARALARLMKAAETLTALDVEALALVAEQYAAAAGEVRSPFAGNCGTSNAAGINCGKAFGHMDACAPATRGLNW